MCPMVSRAGVGVYVKRHTVVAPRLATASRSPKLRGPPPGRKGGPVPAAANDQKARRAASIWPAIAADRSAPLIPAARRWACDAGATGTQAPTPSFVAWQCAPVQGSTAWRSCLHERRCSTPPPSPHSRRSARRWPGETSWLTEHSTAVRSNLWSPAVGSTESRSSGTSSVAALGPNNESRWRAYAKTLTPRSRLCRRCCFTQSGSSR